MNISQKQIAGVLALDGDGRYKHFIKVVADKEEAWGLYQDGWAMASTDDGKPVFPLWPAKIYAELCSVSEWAGYRAKKIELTDLLNALLPKLKSDGALPGIFFSLQGNGVTPSVETLKEDLKTELKNY